MRAGPYKGRSHTARSTFSFFITVFNDGKEHYHFYVEYNYSFKSRKMLKNVVGVRVCVSDACVCVSLYLFVSVCVLQNRVVSSSSGPLFATRGGMRVLLGGGGLTHLQTSFEEPRYLRKMQSAQFGIFPVANLMMERLSLRMNLKNPNFFLLGARLQNTCRQPQTKLLKEL